MYENLFDRLATHPGRFLLPAEGTDLTKWACIACDQFTSDEGYWQNVEQVRAGAPSAVDIIFPEVYLAQGDERIARINCTMTEYAKSVLTRTVEGFILIERETTDGLRLGLLATIDLTQYDPSPDSVSAVRPTESTVPERVPPRVHIRENAALETGHVLMLADDPECTLVEKLYAVRDTLAPLYDFDLMLGGGHIRAWHVGEEYYPQIAEALRALRERGNGLELAVGDGNHSLAAAAACYKLQGRKEARYAMVEINNMHSPALVFHPIHRALFGVTGTALKEYMAESGLHLADSTCAEGDFALCGQWLRIENAPNPLPVACIQPVLDAYLREYKDVRIDYIHGSDALAALGAQGACTIELKAMDKHAVFAAVQLAPLPRKTFSMGEARDKRYYLEAREIR